MGELTPLKQIAAQTYSALWRGRMKWREFRASLWLQAPPLERWAGPGCHSTIEIDKELLQTCTKYNGWRKDPTLFTKVTVYSLFACVAQFALGFVFAQKWGNKCSAVDRWVLVWLFYDAIVHFTLVSTDLHAGTFTVWPVCNSSPLAAWPCRRDPSSTCHSLEMWQSSDGLLAELCRYTVLQHTHS